jgi:hypothetical protein
MTYFMTIERCPVCGCFLWKRLEDDEEPLKCFVCTEAPLTSVV